MQLAARGEEQNGSLLLRTETVEAWLFTRSTIAVEGGAAVTAGSGGSGAPSPGGETEEPRAFSDVPEGSYCYEPVRWAVERGVTKGSTETTFRPHES